MNQHGCLLEDMRLVECIVVCRLEVACFALETAKGHQCNPRPGRLIQCWKFLTCLPVSVRYPAQACKIRKSSIVMFVRYTLLIMLTPALTLGVQLLSHRLMKWDIANWKRAARVRSPLISDSLQVEVRHAYCYTALVIQLTKNSEQYVNHQLMRSYESLLSR